MSPFPSPPDRRRVTWRPSADGTAGSGDPRRTKRIRNENSRDQRAVKANFAACQREGPSKISHPSTGALRTMAGGPACRWIGQSSLCASWQLLQEPTSLRTAALAAARSSFWAASLSVLALAANAFASFLNEAGSPLGGSFLGRSAASLL